MSSQSDIFGGAGAALRAAGTLPAGFLYESELIGPEDEAELLTHVRVLPFREFEFHGYTGKRRVVSFGWKYDFSGQQLRKAEEIPDFLLAVRALAASFAGLEPEALQQALVTEYRPGAGIGWHRDKAVFGQVVGISLLAPCTLRFRRKEVRISNGSDGVNVASQLGERGRQPAPNVGATSKRIKMKRQWERVNVLAEPRSAYHLSGPARLEWEHSILRVDELRYSITFRNVLED